VQPQLVLRPATRRAPRKHASRDFCFRAAPHVREVEPQARGPPRESAFSSATNAADPTFTGKEEDVEVGLQYFGKRFYAPLLQRWISPDPLTIHALGADPNVYAYVRGRALQAIDPLGLDDEPQGYSREFESINNDTETNEIITFSDATIHAKPPRPAVTDQDKVNDALGFPRSEVQGGWPTAEAVDRARMELPTGVRDDKTLSPVLSPSGVAGWTTESGGTVKVRSREADVSGYAGERPLESTLSPVDVLGPAAARGLWTLGGKGLQLAEMGRRGVAQWHFQRSVSTAQANLTEADAIALTTSRTAGAAAQGDAMAYGRVLEAATGNRLNNWFSGMLYRPASGNWLRPGAVRGPDGRFVSSTDFEGRGFFSGLRFDVTSVGQAATHQAQYPGVLLGVY
jgi:RHS repeat-associated protein